jgi:hypothetical protein
MVPRDDWGNYCQHGHELPDGDLSPGALPVVPRDDSGTNCRNGHELTEGDLLCAICGEGRAEEPVAEADAVRTSLLVNGWRVETRHASVSSEADLFIVGREDEPELALFKHYYRGIEPETVVYPALRELDRDHRPRLLDAGRFEDRAYEVWEHFPLGSLAEVSIAERSAAAFARGVVDELGRALAALEDAGIRHRNLKPASVMVRGRRPLDLVLADFNTASLAEFDLQLSALGRRTRYAAPETIAGVFATSSDWWSLGVILLEALTEGRCFQGVHDKAFLLHLVTRGLRLPDELSGDWRELLMGLLTREPSQRWRWAEVCRWLGGERGIPHGYEIAAPPGASGPSLDLGGTAHFTSETFALAAAEEATWEDAKDLLLKGAIATWLEELGAESKRVTELRRVAGDVSLDPDAQLALSLLILNGNIPLCHRGEIVNPAWLLANPTLGIAWLDSPLPSHLGRLGRETWLVRLRERADRVRSRVAEHAIPVQEELLGVALLATSTATLEARWHEERRLFPEATHAGLGVAMDRRSPSDEELIILVSAELKALRPAEDVLAEARRLAREAEVTEFEPTVGRAWFDQSRREIFDALNDRLRGFRRCGRQRADDWADAFRLERRLSLARTLVLLAVPEGEWREPPRQQYVQNVLDFFSRRLVSAVQRGPLVRLTISRTSPRLDMSELGTAIKPASVLLDAVVGRSGQSTSLDPSVLLSDLLREQRLRRLIQAAAIYRRDTGIHALYVGFPFLLMRDARSSEFAMTRVAPVLLWPISIEVGTGARGQARIAFDRERDEVRLNPAFESMLGSDRVVGWREAADEILRHDTTRVIDVMGVFGTLAEADGAELRSMPPTDLKMKIGECRLHCSAAVFLCDFSGQTIAEDLRHITQRPVQGTALEVAIRVGEIRGEAIPPYVSETDRYFTVEADPSQEAAVFRARSHPGLVVQGPPGTGKSQTIVHIICDCIGRGERVLVVCQKQAALEVVRKRLAAEGLENRLFLLDDTVSDRRPTLLALRAQLETIANRPVSSAPRLRVEREALARRIETLEATLNENSEALHRPDPCCGQSYREVLAQLLAVEDGVGPPVPVPTLRPLLGPTRPDDVEQLCEEVAILAPLWLDSRFENSPLHALRPFGSDPLLIEEFSAVFAQLTEVEAARKKAVALHTSFFDIEAPEPLSRWLSTHEVRLRGLSERAMANLARWYDLFCPDGSSDGQGNPIISNLEQVVARLERLPISDHDVHVSPQLAQIPDADLRTWGNVAAFLSGPASRLSFFNPRRALRRRRLRTFLRPLGLEVDPTSLSAFSRAAKLELGLRPERNILADARARFGEAAGEPQMLLDIRRSAAALLSDVKEARSVAEAITTCPLSEPALEVMHCGEGSRYLKWLDACHSSLHRFAAKRASLARLAEVGQWMQPAWIQEALEQITGNRDTTADLAQIVESLGAIAAFQRFRVRAQGLGQGALRAFAVLRTREKVWRRFSPAELTVEVRRTLKREALLAWKNDIEARSPALLVERAETERNVRTLAELDQRFKRLNQELLAGCPDQSTLAPRRDWDDVLMLTGPRARRLREVVERGERLGLFLLRPVWLCSPDMVSRLFGLRPGMFDIVVFDEASQLPVESALPALFRAKRFVVSGDEKQLPPTNFFNSRFGSDEEELDDDWLESDSGEMEDEARRQREETLNRQEVKDCGDLLALAQTVLPTTTLEIHYRSRYRQLIAFSNSAFYSGRLNVPAQHPHSEILRARPIEVIRAESEYRSQTNPGEAHQVVDLLRDVWVERPRLQRPSLGVVTFNHKQADLILDLIEDRANEDQNFRTALAEELQRKQNGEDMSFFVKNLENVQGDERDWIVFSTTFGRDARGVFRRYFGAVGQRGGERRLNVAVTRARHRVVLITSMPVPQVSSFVGGHRAPHYARDFLQAYLDYAGKVSDGDLETAETSLLALASGQARGRRQNGRQNDRFVEEVRWFLESEGFEPVPPSNQGAFALDFAIEDPRTGLFGVGIECDPPRHSLLSTARARELWRPRVLQSGIPRVHRVWSRAWYHDRTSEQRNLLQTVHESLRA